jgi:hypothetical protein
MEEGKPGQLDVYVGTTLVSSVGILGKLLGAGTKRLVEDVGKRLKEPPLPSG